MMVKHLLPLIPEHRIYVEVFGGGASLLFAKDPSPVEVYNDLDSGLVGFFRVLRDPEKFARLQELCRLTPYSREEYNLFMTTWENEENDVERAFQWYVIARMSFGGMFGSSWGSAVSASCRGMAKTTSGWLGIQALLPLLHQRVMRVQIEHEDYRKILSRYDTPETFFYLDPPYLKETRRSGGYKHELETKDHQDLVQALLNLKGSAILSGYAHSTYAPLEAAGWMRKDFDAVCSAAGRTRTSGLQGIGNVKNRQRRTETIWISPNSSPGG